MSYQTDTKGDSDAGRSRSTPWKAALALLISLTVVFGTTAEWDDSAINMDAEAAALPAWSLVNNGSIELSHADTFNPWITETAEGEFSNRPPAISALALPSYAVTRPAPFSNAPATATAVAITALAITLLFLALARSAPVTWALGVVLVVAFGTATLPIASTQLWPHGPGQLTAALGIFGLATSRNVIAASGLGYGTLLRPPAVIFAGIIALDAARLRKWNQAAVIGGAGLAALTVTSLYNLWLFGSFGLTGGYSPVFAQRLASIDLEYFSNLAHMFVLPPNGLLFWSPIVLVAIFAVIQERPAVTNWMRASAVAALVYLLVHAQLNRASGGLAFNYRYPLEALALATPWLSAGAREWWKRGSTRRVIVTVAAVLSIGLQALYMFGLTCQPYSQGLVACSLIF